MAVPLSFYKYVKFTDIKLRLLYYGGLVALVSFLAMRLIVNSEYARKDPMGPYIHPDLRANTDYHELLNCSVEMQNSTLCLNGDHYSYWADEHGNFGYANHRCQKVCGLGTSPLSDITGECVVHRELVKNIAPNKILFMTEFQDKFLTSASPIGPDRKTMDSFFSPFEHAFMIELSYMFIVPKSASDMPWIASDFAGDSKKNSSFRILDYAGNEVMHASPNGTALSLKLVDLLAWSGKSNALDSILPSRGRNFLQGATHPEGPLGRISGLSIELTLSCYDAPSKPRSISGSDCALSVSSADNSWQEYTQIDIIRESQTQMIRARRYHGIVVQLKTGGSFQVASIRLILAFVVTCAVLLPLPAKGVQMIATSLLGHTSVLYKQAIYEGFDLSEHVAGIATRLMTGSFIYLQLQEHGAGISRDRMIEILELACKDMNQDEKEVFAKFCFLAVTKPHLTEDTWRDAVATSHKRKTKSRRHHHHHHQHSVRMNPSEKSVSSSMMIDIESFLSAISSSDRLAFKDVVKLFDWDRHVGMLESWATLTWLKKNVVYAKERARNQVKAEEEDDDDDDRQEFNMFREMVDGEFGGEPSMSVHSFGKFATQCFDSFSLNAQQQFMGRAICLTSTLKESWKEMVSHNSELSQRQQVLENRFIEQGLAAERQLQQLGTTAEHAYATAKQCMEYGNTSHSSDLSASGSKRVSSASKADLPMQNDGTFPTSKLRNLVRMMVAPDSNFTAEEVDAIIYKGKCKLGIEHKDDLSLKEISLLMPEISLESMT